VLLHGRHLRLTATELHEFARTSPKAKLLATRQHRHLSALRGLHVRLQELVQVALTADLTLARDGAAYGVPLADFGRRAAAHQPRVLPAMTQGN